jgi:hypothetical protein
MSGTIAGGNGDESHLPVASMLRWHGVLPYNVFVDDIHITSGMDGQKALVWLLEPTLDHPGKAVNDGFFTATGFE